MNQISTKLKEFPQRKGGNPKKAGATLVTKRVEIIYDLLISGFKRSEILEFVRRNEYILDKATGLPKEPIEKNPIFDFGRASLDIYLSRANEKFEEVVIENRKRKAGIAEARYELIIRMALEKKDLFNAINAQSKLDKIQGNVAPTETNINVRGRSPEELRARLIAIFVEAQNRSLKEK